MPDNSQPDVRIFYANTRFEQMARRPGGVPRQKAMAQAQAKIDELKSGFNDWLDRELRQLNDALAKVENDLNDNASLETAYRNCAQLQSVCAAMGFELVTFVAENLCKIISTMMSGAAYDKDIVDCHINAFLLAKTDQYRAMSPEQVPEMASGLRRVVELAGRNSVRKSAAMDE
ncbi:MAG TPA: hypothetical protein VMG39_09940 [Pseudolabrys sp.]|nr:hypothetical protein [Pseudolabrys sp.]HUI13177.1 hypothetical protein [Xanthobacteraceae bacterium]